MNTITQWAWNPPPGCVQCSVHFTGNRQLFCFNLWFQSKCRILQCQKSGFKVKLRLLWLFFFFVLFWTEARPSAVAMLLTQSLWEQRRQLPPPGKCSEVGIPTVVPFCFYVDRAGSPHKLILKEILAYSPGSQMRRNSTSVKCDSRINLVFELAKKVHLTETLNHLFNQCSDFSPILEGKTISGEYVSVEGTILFNLIGFNIECATFPH